MIYWARRGAARRGAARQGVARRGKARQTKIMGACMKSTKINVTLQGIRPIMFDRFASMKTELSPEDKVYQKDGNLVLPAKNIMSYLSAENTESAPRRIVGKKWKTICKAAMSFVDISPFDIPFDREGDSIPSDSVEIIYDKAIVKKGTLSIPSEKQRPLLSLPWSLSFVIELFQNADLNEAMLRRLFEEGGIMIGLGTYRGVYGKFIVQKWAIE
jgi:hypothetical protein